MTVTQPGGGDDRRTTRFEPVVRRPNSQERVIVWGLTAIDLLGLAIGLAIMTSGQYRGILAYFATAALCLLMGYLTLRPRTVFDRSGIHGRTLLRSYNVAWPGSREAFDITRQPRSALRIREADPNVQATVRGEAGMVVLGGMSTRAFIELKVRYLTKEELNRLWAWAASWRLVPAENPEDTGIHGREDNGPSHS